MRLLELTSALFGVRATTAIRESRDSGPVTPTRVVRYATCAIMVALFVWSSTPSVRRALEGPSPGRIDAFHSTNAYLQAVTGSAGASQRVIDVMDSLPSGKPLLIFVRDRNAASSLLGMALAYLAWPRDVRFETIDGPQCDQELARIAPNSVGGVAFCDVQSPAWIPRGMRLGQNSKLITLAQSESK